MFIGRSEELFKLREFAGSVSDKRRLFVLKGRRGIGKTSLLKEFLADNKGLYFCAYPTTDDDEEALLEAEFFAATKRRVFPEGEEKGKSLSERFTRLLTLVEKEAGGSEFTLVIDDAPSLMRADSAFEDILYDFVMERWSETKISIIFSCDSFLSMDKVMGSEKGTRRWTKAYYGGMTLKPMSFYSVKDFLTGAATEEQVFLYGLSGGIPRELEILAEEYSRDSIEPMIKRGVKALIFSNEAVGTLPEDILEIDLREKSYYNRILATLAGGLSRVNEISAAVKKPKDIVVPYMNTLMNLDFVVKENPVTEPNNRRKTRYSIVNTFYLFWYRFVAPHMDYIYSGRIDEFIDECVMPGIDSFIREVFVKICKEFVKGGGTGLPVTVNAVGNWWVNDDEKKTTADFDLVCSGTTEDEKSSLIFGRCYIGENKPVDMASLKGLIDLTKKVREKGEVDYYIAFSNNGFHDTAVTAANAIKNIILISMEDIVKQNIRNQTENL